MNFERKYLRGGEGKIDYTSYNGKLKIGKNVKNIPSYIFKELVFKEVSQLLSIGDKAFFNNMFTRILLSLNNYISIGISAFLNALTSNKGVTKGSRDINVYKYY